METYLQSGAVSRHDPHDGRTHLAPGMGDLVLDELAYGVAVSTAGGELVHANDAARHELGRRRVLWVRHGQLQTQTADARPLADGLCKAAAGKRSLLNLVGEGGDKLALALVPLGRGEPAAMHVALLFSRASVCESLMLCFFARSHCLTGAEETVLRILCQGYSAPEVARQLEVAVSTVRSHVRSLCAKTRSSGVRELVSRVAMLPPVAPALRCDPLH
ncbi:MAG: helix-turn-helix transcriptional regulator [Comamonadaceae bacterium]|nr:MAG: helix-turn-helix transcriptional regulator [Comamonadaceae bacterium]